MVAVVRNFRPRILEESQEGGVKLDSFTYTHWCKKWRLYVARNSTAANILLQSAVVAGIYLGAVPAAAVNCLTIFEDAGKEKRQIKSCAR